MLYPPAIYRPVVNHGGALGPDILGLVVHVQADTGSPFGYFNTPASEASSHWWISQTGAVEQYVDTALQAWAQAAGNADYLSVETEGEPTDPLTPAQIAALTLLVQWVNRMFAMPLRMVNHGAAGVTTHAFYPSGIPDPAWGDHPCPGPVRAAQLPFIITAALKEEFVPAHIYACENQPTVGESAAGTVILLDQAALDRWVAAYGGTGIIERVGTFESQQWVKKASL